MTRIRRQRLQARLGASLIAGSTALALVAIPVGGGAQEEPAPEPVTVEAEALYVRAAGESTPNSVTSEFPPGVVCLVVPEFCGQDAQEITGPVDSALTGDVNADGEQDADRPTDTPDDQSPQQPVAPNTYTVAQSNGEQRYASGFRFKLPEVPDGHQVVSATLVLSETQPTYHTSSPALRQAALAALAGYRDQQQGLEEFQKIFTQPDRFPPGEAELGEVGAEICPFTAPMEEGSHNWEETPESDCIYGSNGVRDEQGNWTFDLTFALQAWRDGSLPNNGLYLRETAAPNMAYGDPDPTWQTQISWGAAGNESTPGPQVIVETAAAPEPVEFEPLPAPGNADSSSGGGTSSGQQGGFFGQPPALSSGGGPTSPGPVPDVAGQPEGQQAPVAAPVPVRSPSTTPWWVWLLVPTFAAGMGLFSRSLTTDVEAVGERAGAMTRLIQQRNGDGVASAPGPMSFQV